MERSNSFERGRRGRALVFALLSTFLLSTNLWAPIRVAGAEPLTTESEFVRLANQLRTGLGLSALTVDPELTSVARKWSQKMAEKGDIFHNEQLASDVKANWSKLGENVGMGDDLPLIENLWEKSPAHYRNLVDASFELVGIGVVETGGVIFVTTDFAKLAPTALRGARFGPTSTAPPITAPPITAPPSTAPPSTAPPITAPPITAPPSTAPPITAPPSTAPPITAPPITTSPGPSSAVSRSSIPEILALGMVESRPKSKMKKRAVRHR